MAKRSTKDTLRTALPVLLIGGGVSLAFFFFLFTEQWQVIRRKYNLPI